MDVVDRITATDRAVAAYRRFVDADGIDVVPDMISDLLHWHRIMIDNHVSDDALRGMLDSALDQYDSELARFGLGDDPLSGNRRESNPFRVDEPPLNARRMAEEGIYSTPSPEPAASDWRAELSYSDPELCQCPECVAHREQERIEQAELMRQQALAEISAMRIHVGGGGTPGRNIPRLDEEDIEF